MTSEIPLGTRVVLRYRLPPGYAQVVTDVIGELLSLDPPRVRSKSGEVLEIAADRVVALKALGPRPIRTSEIRALERAAADGWPGIEQEWIDGWLLRYGAGFTGRANSAAPLGDSVGPLPLDRIRQWFALRGEDFRLLLPDRLGAVPSGWHSWDEVAVLAADIDNIVLPDGPAMITITDRPGPEWLSLYRYRGSVPPPAAVSLLEAVRDGQVAFGHLLVVDGQPLAIARAAITSAPDGRRWVGLTAVEVAPQHRRHGLGTLICARMIRWGLDNGATHAYLQVAVDNEPAIAMYRRLGFIDHHHYRYARPEG
ncbi:GNAT family N-acetyltransferase [Antrihabitans sp. YC2-6]|uniref:N-acetylglutamate synthase, CG3035 family n=1 Tax=Antrihabitans sp. YC2-6 TaxID=2799498 RepID=UPI0018F52939|nr:GNAT family N-acetyltransferase [Antrihabitans sp. YC2-6]MBJ8348585.1 GNAT family N-acetyltransferase [Antrihabitans sp. YC2-6]